MKLGIDPGHGGRNEGTRAGGIYEKDETLALALSLSYTLPQEIIQEMLRLGDEYVSNPDRGVRSATCDWVLSIHVNANVNKDYNGAEAYVLPGRRLPERLVARQILASMPPELRTTRLMVADPDKEKWLEAPYAVLSPHVGRAVLIEVGFASNPTDLSVLQSSWGRMAIVSALRAGVAQMLREVV
jgi:N-acetylmuramoyl-L-alanine amidase